MAWEPCTDEEMFQKVLNLEDHNCQPTTQCPQLCNWKEFSPFQGMKQRQETSESSIIEGMKQRHLERMKQRQKILDSLWKFQETLSKLVFTDHQKETFKEILAVINLESNISKQLSKFGRNQNSLIFKKMNLYSDKSIDTITKISSGSHQYGMLFLDKFVDILQTEKPNWSIPKFTESKNELDLEQLLNHVKAKNKLMGDILLALNKLLVIVSWLFLPIVCTLRLCLFLSSCILKGHQSAMLKKYLVLKYACHNAILYLLWCSGDVELHPGPTFKKIRILADSQKERNWMHDMCSILLKILLGLDVSTKTDGIWKDKPKGWPENQLFYDPKNKPKGQICNSETDRELLKNLINCCRSSSKEIPKEYQDEVNAWEHGNRKQLFDLYATRSEISVISKAVKELQYYKDEPCLCKSLQSHGFEVKFIASQTCLEPLKNGTDIVRDLAITVCRLAKGLPLTEKSDGIWKEPPKGWNPDIKYFSPCNAGKRSSKNDDRNLLNNLIDYCKEKKKTIPEDLSLILQAIERGNTSDVSKFYTIWASSLQIQHSLQYLEMEGLLEQPWVRQKLDALGMHKLQTCRNLKRKADEENESVPKRPALDTIDEQVMASSSTAISISTTESRSHDSPPSPASSTSTDISLDIFSFNFDSPIENQLVSSTSASSTIASSTAVTNGISTDNGSSLDESSSAWLDETICDIVNDKNFSFVLD